MPLLLSAAVLLIAPADVATSQEFGRNKVRYEDFDFQVLETDHFDLLYYDNLSDAAEWSGRMLERWNSRFERLFDHTLSSRQPVVLYEDHPDFQQTNVISGLISQGIGGVTEGRQGRIVLPLSPSNTQNDHVLGHELVHGFHFDLVEQFAGSVGFVQNVPLWFIEGVAEYATLGASDPQTAMWMRDAVARDDLPSVRKLGRAPEYNVYRFGHALWAYMGHAFGDDKLADLYKETLAHGFGRAASTVLGVSPDELTERWHEDLRKLYNPQIRRRNAPNEVGSAVLPDRDGLMISPSLRDDGKYVAFFSQPDVFSLALTVADVESGEIVGRLSTTGTNRHFDQLRFTDSSGTFSPEGDRFAFIIQRRGDNGVAIASVPDLKIQQTFFWDDVTGLSHVAWHPEGDRLVLAGSQGGQSDLYEVDLPDGSIRPITEDRYSALQPTYDRRGERIAYVTDAGEDTSLDELSFGAMKIALRDVETGAEELVALPGATKHINPHFSRDGRHLYFVADPDGVSNVYRYDLGTGTTVRLTNASTGVAGFTDLAPALSVAGSDDTAAFTVFTEREYSLRTMDLAGVEGVPVIDGERAAGAHLTPPGFRNFIVSTYLDQEQRGLISADSSRSEPYRPRLRLTSVGQAALGVTFSRFGSSVFGTVNFNFSDLLSDHLLSLYLQLAGSTRDLGGQATYFNREQRLGWGVSASRTPTWSVETTTEEGTITQDDGSEDGEEVEATITQQVIDRAYVDRVQLLGEYPLSGNLRFEGVGGYTRVSFLQEIQTVATKDGSTLVEQTQTTTPEQPLNLAQGGLAFVGDYSSSGYTGPLDGNRFRAAVDASVGSLTLVNSRVDFRQYLFLRPVAFAFQALHHGQYLQSGTDGLVGPLDLGSDFYVRGYYPGSYTEDDCDPEAQSCPEYERIFGSQVAAAKAEIRLPLLGTEQLGLLPFRYLPTTLFAFADAGIAWSPADPPQWTWARSTDARVPVASVGGGARFNLLGAFVLQVYYAYPFQRPARGGYVNIVLAPGF
ncbi:MAG: peptidase S9 [Spirochaetota bacterium]